MEKMESAVLRQVDVQNASCWFSQSSGARWQSDRSKRFTLPLAEVTLRARMSILLGAPMLLP